MKKLLISSLLLLTVNSLFAIEYHVSKSGNDQNDGKTLSTSFLTIQQAASIAIAGDTITVYEGVYRERVDPKFGGSGEYNRIVYRAAENNKAIIKGSEEVKEWKKYKGDTWVTEVSNSMFNGYNPYEILWAGDWFDTTGGVHHIGEVFVNEQSMFEQNSLDSLVNIKENSWAMDKEASLYGWYAEVGEQTTTIWANFHGLDPRKEQVEIVARNCCFYPSKPGKDFITVTGFEMSQCGNQWAPPTQEQEGLIGTHWSKGWIIENNIIRNAKSSGVSLGKYGDSGKGKIEMLPAKEGQNLYVEVVYEALRNNWSKEGVGSHIVRNNIIYDCGQAGVIGSLGCAFSKIQNNHIYNIFRKRHYTGQEMASIKLHGGIDVVIENNVLHDSHCGIWMDWMAQGARISRNVVFNNDQYDFHDEVNQGPMMVDHNLFLSDVAVTIRSVSNATAYAHNIVVGRTYHFASNRTTPYFMPHSTKPKAYSAIFGGDSRFFNNIYIACDGAADLTPNRHFNPKSIVSRGGIEHFSKFAVESYSAGNIFYNGATTYKDEKNSIEVEGFIPTIEVITQEDGITLELTFDSSPAKAKTELVTTEQLGITMMTEEYYENPDQTPYIFDTDFFGVKRNISKPISGPFEDLKTGKNIYKIDFPKL